MSSRLSRDIERAGSRISRNAHIALRAERVIARRRLAVIRTQTGLMAFAGLVAGIGLIMVNISLFFWMAESLGNAAAGGILAVVNFALAIILGLVAGRMNVEKELEPAVAVRDLAMEEIEAELADGVNEAKYLVDNVRRIASDPLGAGARSVLGPVLSILLKSLKK